MDAQKYAPVAEHAMMCKRHVRRVLHSIQSRGSRDHSTPLVLPSHLRPTHLLRESQCFWRSGCQCRIAPPGLQTLTPSPMCPWRCHQHDSEQTGAFYSEPERNTRSRPVITYCFRSKSLWCNHTRMFPFTLIAVLLP